MPVPAREYRVGVVGVGGRGRQLLECWKDFPGAKVVAVADLKPELLEKALEIMPGVNTYPSHLEMLQNEEIDIVTIGTTGHFHATITKDSAAHGVKGVYCEKPMANSLADADIMINSCKESGTVLQIGHQRRWLIGTTRVRQAIKDGQIGRPTFGYVYWPTGRIGSNGTHFIDAINFILDSKPVEVVGRVQYGLDLTKVDEHPAYSTRSLKDPGAFGFVTYENGARIAIDAMNDVLLPYTYMFGGSRGRIDLEEVSWFYDYRGRDQDSRSHRDSWTVPTRYPMETLDEEAGIAERASYQEIIDCIESGERPTSSGEDGRLTLETIVAFHLSSDAGMAPVSLPLPASANDYTLDIH
jgi:predicted dehydrogenase